MDLNASAASDVTGGRRHGRDRTADPVHGNRQADEGHQIRQAFRRVAETTRNAANPTSAAPAANKSARAGSSAVRVDVHPRPDVTRYRGATTAAPASKSARLTSSRDVFDGLVSVTSSGERPHVAPGVAVVTRAYSSRGQTPSVEPHVLA